MVKHCGVLGFGGFKSKISPRWNAPFLALRFNKKIIKNRKPNCPKNRTETLIKAGARILPFPRKEAWAYRVPFQEHEAMRQLKKCMCDVEGTGVNNVPKAWTHLLKMLLLVVCLLAACLSVCHTLDITVLPYERRTRCVVGCETGRERGQTHSQ